MSFKNLKIGYVPLSQDFTHPADRRRFHFFCKQKNIKFEIAIFEKSYDYVIVTGLADFTLWSTYRKGKIVFELLDPYIFEKNKKIKNFLRSFGKTLLGNFKYANFNYHSLLRKMCKNSYAVICATDSHIRTLKKFNPNIHSIPDYHGEILNENYSKKKFSLNNKIEIFWEGYPINLLSTEFKKLIKNLKNNKKIQFKFNIVTDKSFYLFFNKFLIQNTNTILRKYNIDFKLYDWNTTNIREAANKSDIGVIPLNLKNIFEKNKPENKLLLMWRLGLPTLTSNTPAYRNIMNKNNCENYFIIKKNDWSDKISNLNHMDIEKIVKKNLNFINLNYNKNNIIEKWEKVFK